MPNESITLTPTGHAFTRNPIMLNMPGTGRRVFMVYGQGYTSDDPAYKGEVTAPATINLAEFIEAIIPSLEDPGERGDLISYGLQDGSVTIKVTDGEDTLFTQTINAHHGGVSKQNWRRLKKAGTDIFAARFLNPECNFFLTTRTNDWRLSLKETELYPLVFFYPSTGTLAVQDIVGGDTVTLAASSGGVDYHGKLCALNLKAIRRHFLDEYGCIAGAFDVLVDGSPGARIAIQEARPELERYRLKFRNSYGAFEIIEITGKAHWAPTIEGDEEECTYKRYQADIDDFASERQRTAMRQELNLSTGYKTNGELRFLLDAIASDEIYLLDMGTDPVKVIATADEMAFDHQPNGPQQFNLVLKPTDDDHCLTPELGEDLAPGRGELFSPEYSEQFD